MHVGRPPLQPRPPTRRLWAQGELSRAMKSSLELEELPRVSLKVPCAPK